MNDRPYPLPVDPKQNMCHFSSFFGKNPFTVNEIKSQRKENFTHRRHAAGLPTLDTIDSQRRNSSLSSQFGLAHQQAFSDFLDTIRHKIRPSRQK